jgi:hypothetical protein
MADGNLISIAPNLEVQNLSSFATDENLHGTATDFAIDGELLGGLGRVNRQRERLSAIWTLNVFRFLHLPCQRKDVMLR